MTAIGTGEATTHFPKLFEQVEAGGTVVITRDGRPVAQLVSVPRQEGREPGVSELIERWIDGRKGVTLAGLKVSDLIDEGRT